MPAKSLAPGAWTAAELEPGERISVRALRAGQAAEVAIHRRPDARERLSTLLTSLAEGTYTLYPGLPLHSQEYTELMRVVSQTNDRHDLSLEACNPWLNKALTGAPTNGSCWSNFKAWADAVGIDEKWIPYPLGLFRQAGEHEGRFQLLQGTSEAGDSVVLEASESCTVIVSACPLTCPPDAGEQPTLEVSWDG